MGSNRTIKNQANFTYLEFRHADITLTSQNIISTLPLTKKIPWNFRPGKKTVLLPGTNWQTWKRVTEKSGFKDRKAQIAVSLIRVHPATKQLSTFKLIRIHPQNAKVKYG